MRRMRSRSAEVWLQWGPVNPVCGRSKKQYGRASSLCGKKKRADGAETSPHAPLSDARAHFYSAVSRHDRLHAVVLAGGGRTPFPFRAVDSMHLEALFRQQQTDTVTLKFAHAPWKDVTITKDAIVNGGGDG